MQRHVARPDGVTIRGNVTSVYPPLAAYNPHSFYGVVGLSATKQ